MFTVIDEIFVGLVCDDNESVINRELCDLFNFFLCEHDSGWIRRGVEVNCPRLIGDVFQQRFASSLFACFRRGHQHETSTAVRNQILYRCPVRREDQNVFTWIDHRLERAE